jgi:preprotein translocase subunit SecD
VVALVLVGLYLGVFLGPSATPSLGLDLRGGTEVTLTAHPIAGGSVTKGALNQAVDIIRQRANGLGVGGADVNTQGSDNIVVSVPGKGHDQVVKQIGQTALLRFRQAEAITSGAPPAPTASPSATVSPSPGGKSKHPKSHPKATATPKKSTKSSSQGMALSSALEKKHPSTTATPSPGVTVTPTLPATPQHRCRAASPEP